MNVSVETVSDRDSAANEVAAVVRELWGKKFTTARAGALLAHFRRYRVDQVLWALRKHRVDNPDDTFPAFREIGSILLLADRNIAGYRPQGDDDDPIRLQLHTIIRLCTEAKRPVPDWLSELVAVDAQAPHGEACRRWLIYAIDPIGAQWFMRGAWRRERNPEMHKVGLERCRVACKALPAVGPQTERQKLEWLARIADEASALEHVTASREAFDVHVQAGDQAPSIAAIVEPEQTVYEPPDAYDKLF